MDSQNLWINFTKKRNSAIGTQVSEIITYSQPLDLKVRPIVGEPKRPTRKLGKFIDILLKAFLKHVPSFINIS